MNTNVEKSSLLSLHAAYNKCLKERLDQWLGGGQDQLENEWCVEQRSAYMEHMRNEVPVEYENLRKLEERMF